MVVHVRYTCADASHPRFDKTKVLTDSWDKILMAVFAVPVTSQRQRRFSPNRDRIESNFPPHILLLPYLNFVLHQYHRIHQCALILHTCATASLPPPSPVAAAAAAINGHQTCVHYHDSPLSSRPAEKAIHFGMFSFFAF